jgi:hypothetical protein
MKSLILWKSTMPFNHLLFDSLKPGVTLAEDRGSGCYTSTDLRRDAEETVLLFGLDDSATRRRLSLNDGKCCDYLYFLKNNIRTELIFVELKSTNIESATHQITSAHSAICDRCHTFKSRGTRAKAIIVSSQASPRDTKAIQDRMKKRGIDLYFGISRKGHPCQIKNLIPDLSARKKI